MTKIDKAIEWAVSIANDDSHGYDQANRWGPDYDCSSLIISAWENAGVPVKEKGATYTGNMKKAFLACGFVEVSIDDRKKGDVLLNEGHHTAMMIDDKNLVNASINEQGKIVGGKKGDQTGKEICVRSYYKYSRGWDCCLRYVEETPKKEEPAPTYYIVMSGDTLTKIAKKFGTTVSKLVEWNDIKDKNKIYAGQKLRVTAPNAPITASKSYYVKVTAQSGLNVRKGAGTQFNIISVLGNGSTVEIFEESNGWGRTKLGWISLKYTTKA